MVSGLVLTKLASVDDGTPEPCINRIWPMTFRLLFDGRHFRSISLEKYIAGVLGVAQNVAKQAISYLLFQLTNADSYGII